MSLKANHPSAVRRFLPPIGSRRYHLLLSAVALFILGPLGGIAAAYMTFALGFFIGGQVLAGLLGSAVTFGYGPEGKHGANYMQTMAASVATMSAMGALIQAMTWLGLPELPAWQLILYFTCIGMFGVGVGMLYTPILVDRMQLAFPSGYAVANILRALTDRRLLQQSIAKLGGSMVAGFAGGLASAKIPIIEALGISTATIGAGMVIGARLTLPALMVGLIGRGLTPWLRSIGWLGPSDPFRRIGFVIALGTILGAAVVDLFLIAVQAIRRLREDMPVSVDPKDDWKQTNTLRLALWILIWAAGLVFVATTFLHQPFFYVVLAISLSFIFLLINGIAMGISDNNPISSAFVVAVFLMTLFGLKDPGVGMMCAAILLVSTAVGVDMQQDRSTGWRLGTSRVMQFRYQVMGVLMGAIMAVALAKLFMNAYPVLRIDSFSNPNVEGAQQWQSAMTYKFVGAIRGLTNPRPYVTKALMIGIGIGLITEVLRKIAKASQGYQRYIRSGKGGGAVDFLLDTFVIPSPYASSFGGFVELLTSVWFAAGGVVASLMESFSKKKMAQTAATESGEIPADMSTTSLIGGGLIGGDSLAALAIGIYGLLRSVF